MKNVVIGLMALVLSSRCAEVCGQPVITSIRQNEDTVGMFGKFEAGLAMRANYNNPFDPDQIDIKAELTSPSDRTQLLCWCRCDVNKMVIISSMKLEWFGSAALQCGGQG